MIKINTSDLKKQVVSLKSQLEPSLTGTIKGKSSVLELKEDIGDSSYQMSSPKTQNNQKYTKKISATVESLLTDKKKIWKDKLSSSPINTLTTKLSRILDPVLTSKGKVLKPWWTKESKVISEKLWLPTKIDSVVSVLNSSKESSKPTPMGKSWFSIKKKLPLKKNSLMTSFQSSQFSLVDSMDSGVTPLKTKSKIVPLKTLKLRIFPTNEEQIKLHTMMDQFRWYYNSAITITYNHYGYKEIPKEKKYSSYTVRDLIRKYKYTENTIDNLTFKDFIYDENTNSIPIPEWWKGNVHSRLPRGAINKFVSSLNSALSNLKNKNIKHFKMKYRSKKSPTDYLNFEDKSYPAFIRKIKSKYWYTTKDRKRKSIPLGDINTQKRGIEIVYEKATNKYFLHYPVERDWLPEDDKRNDSQVKFIPKGDRIISLDPGIRKFLVGYDPRGETVFIGEKASEKLIQLLLDIDKIEDPKIKYLKWKKAKNMVSELHWKTISFLIENYDTIILPDFRVSQMLKKKKLGRKTKRLMCMFSFYSFKEKLKWKCNTYGKKLVIVDESYTSCTCGMCGKINKTGSNEVFHCVGCGVELDRDVQGSRNILLKNITLR